LPPFCTSVFDEFALAIERISASPSFGFSWPLGRGGLAGYVQHNAAFYNAKAEFEMDFDFSRLTGFGIGLRTRA
jgi:hypothetical protein